MLLIRPGNEKIACAQHIIAPDRHPFNLTRLDETKLIGALMRMRP